MNKTNARKVFGRGRFSVRDAAGKLEVSEQVARIRLRKLTDAGIIERAGTDKVTDDEGNIVRGQPRHLWKVSKGK